MAPPYSELWGASPVRRLLLAGLENVAVSRPGAPGEAVARGGIGLWLKLGHGLRFWVLSPTNRGSCWVNI